MAEEKPNILIILSDQHRFDCLGAYEHPDIKTPHIDSLAGDGVVYKNCFATFPVCTPSRYSFLSGLYVHQHLGWNNRSTLPRGLSTFPRVLKEIGYKTKAVGKMHFTPTYLDVGFDEMILSEQDGPGRYDDDYHRYLKERGLIDFTDMRDQVYEMRSQAEKDYYDNFGSEAAILDEKHYNTTWIGDRACETIDSWNGGGHLLEVGFIKPHHPHDCPKPWSEMYDPDELTLPDGWTEAPLDRDRKFSKGFFDYSRMDEKALRKIMAKYYGSISQIDHHVGRMIKLLKDKGLYENTLIIYTSDHGDYMGFHHMVLKGNYMYDPVIKIPLVVKYPDNENAGSIEERLVSNIDITTTIIDQAEAFVPRSMWRTSRPIYGEERDTVFAEQPNCYMIRTKNRKLILHEDGEDQFYDLSKDPHELENQINNDIYSEDINELKQRFVQWIAFDSRSVVNQDKRGFTISAENVPDFDDGHDESMREYLKKKMEETYTTRKSK